MDPIAHHFLLCLDAKYDLTDPVAPYSLLRLAFELRPPDGTEFPFVVDLWTFARLIGTGVREFSVDVYALPPDPDDGEAELIVAHLGLLARFGIEPSGLSRTWVLPRNPFPRPGRYEFRLVCEDEVLATETIHLFEA